jgi:hypothetical protein
LLILGNPTFFQKRSRQQKYPIAANCGLSRVHYLSESEKTDPSWGVFFVVLGGLWNHRSG